VSTPASDPRTHASLPAALLPVLLHRIHNTTQLLAGVNSLFAMGEVEACASRSGDLAHAAREAEELGWLLGVLACGMGADLLLARRDTFAVAPIVRLVRDGLRREGRDLGSPRETSPEIAPRASWQQCWSIAALLWAAGASLPPGGKLPFELAAIDGGWELCAEVGNGPALSAAAREALELVPGARFAANGEAWRIALPREGRRGPRPQDDRG